MEHRLVRLGLDRAKAVHAAHVVDRIAHRDAPRWRLRRFRQAGADHAVAGDEPGELFLAQALGSGGRIGNTRKRVSAVESQMRTSVCCRQLEAEIREHALRVDDRARAVGADLYQTGGSPSTSHGIAGAQRADDEVVQSGACSRPRSDGADRADMAEGIGRLGRVFEQPLLEFGIDPGARHDPRAVMRPDLRLAGLDDRVERGGIDIALLGQDRFKRPDAELQIGEFRHLARAMRV